MLQQKRKGDIFKEKSTNHIGKGISIHGVDCRVALQFLGAMSHDTITSHVTLYNHAGLIVV